MNGLVAFELSFIYMTEKITFRSTGSSAESNFMGLIRDTFFISGTIVYLKSLEHKE